MTYHHEVISIALSTSLQSTGDRLCHAQKVTGKMRTLEFNPEPQNVGILLEDPHSVQRKESLVDDTEREGVRKRPVGALEGLG